MKTPLEFLVIDVVQIHTVFGISDSERDEQLLRNMFFVLPGTVDSSERSHRVKCIFRGATLRVSCKRGLRSILNHISNFSRRPNVKSLVSILSPLLFFIRAYF